MTYIPPDNADLDALKREVEIELVAIDHCLDEAVKAHLHHSLSLGELCEIWVLVRQARHRIRAHIVMAGIEREFAAGFLDRPAHVDGAAVAREDAHA